MLKFSADLRVNRPVDKVFAWLTNADNQGNLTNHPLPWNFSRRGHGNLVLNSGN
jgi:hypothetical protein